MKHTKTILFALVLFLGCSKKNKEAEVPAEAEAPSVEEKMEMAQSEVTEKMCQRITDCAVSAAKEALGDKQEIDQAKVDEKKAACQEAYTSQKMSGRQINNLAACLSSQNECQPFVACLGEALNPSAAE